jgi:hypothetical protein
MIGWLWRQLQAVFDQRPRVVLGSAGPFIGQWDLGWFKHSLPLHQLDTHIYVVGRSGKGKSKWLEGLLYQLITQDQGCGLIDPHADLANNLLKLLAFHPIGPHRQPWLSDPANFDRLIYCEPGRNDYLMPMNLLVSHEPAYTTATGIIEAFKRTWSQSLGEAPQFENLALHSLLLLIEHQLSLVELPRLLLDQEFRTQLVNRSQQSKIAIYFKQRFGRWGREQAQRIESTLNKGTALTLNPNLELILGAQENRLDLRQIMDQGQILIVNLGTCDPETRNLLGSLLTVRLEQAALSRADLKEQDRVAWYCVIDEMQRFVANEGSAQVLAEILSEVRKFGLRLCLAHQGWHQIENSSRLAGALDQAQVKVVFGSGTKTGRVIADELFTPDPGKIKHEVADPQAQARSHPMFENVLEQQEMFVQAIRKQAHREIFVLPPDSDQIVALKTQTIPQPDAGPADLETLKVRLLQRSGQPVDQLAAQISQRLEAHQRVKKTPPSPGLSAFVRL